MLVGENEATSLVDVQLDVELPVFLECQNMVGRVEHCDTSRSLNRGSSHRTGTGGMDLEGGFLHVFVQRHDQRLQILDDLVDVLYHAWNGLMLVHHPVDPKRPDRTARQRREEHTANGVP